MDACSRRGRWILPALLLLALGALGSAATPSPAGAQTLYGIDTYRDQLVAVDPTTAMATVVGPLGLDALGSGACFLDGQLWAMVRLSSGEDQLCTVDTATGAATPVLTMDHTVGSRGIEFGPLNERLYYNSASELYWVDLDTGVSTLVGDVGISFSQMARSADNTYYMVGGGVLATLDLATATRTPLFSVGSVGAALSWNPTDGRLYTVAGGNLHAIDPLSGVVEAIGPLNYNLNGLAFDYGVVPAEERSWGRVKGRYAGDR